MTWTRKHATEIKRALNKAQGNPRQLHLLVPHISASTWQLFVEFSSCGLAPGVAVSCAIDNEICPICRSRFVGKSNGNYRALCKDCVSHPDAKTYIFQRKQRTLVKTYGSLELANLAINSKKKDTCLQKFGTECSFQAESVKQKAKATMLENYQVEYPSHSPVIQAKKVATSLYNWGTSSPMSNPAVRARADKTVFTRYGVANISQCPAIKAKKVATSFERYGTAHHLQNAEILKKAMLSAHRLYEVVSPRKTYFVQGYERFVIGYLERRYKEVVPQFEKGYKEVRLLDGRYTYRPDFYIPSISTYIEVKSTWTLLTRKGSWEDTVRKFRMLNEAGKKGKLYLVLDRRRLVILPDDWYLLTLKKLKSFVPHFKVIRINQDTIFIEGASDAEENKINDKYNFSTRRVS